jgi:hypothetical protein
MLEATLAAASGFALASAGVYLVVGRAVQQRDVSPAHRRANRMFALWWWCLAAVSALGGLGSLAAGLGWLGGVGTYTAITLAALLLLCLALLGLLFYLLYLFTGRSRLLAPLAASYAALFLALLALVLAAGPSAVEVTRWGARLAYAHPPSAALGAAVGIGLLMPQALAALAYLALARKLPDRPRRARVEMVSLSIFLWFVSSLAASLAGLGSSDAWQVASRAISLAAALTILAAYRPTPWMQRHWGLQAVPRRSG